MHPRRPSTGDRVGHGVAVAQTRLPEHIYGSHLEMHRWRVDDAGPLSRSMGRNIDHLRPWMPWIAHEPLDRAAGVSLIERWDAQWRSGGDVTLGVFAQGDIVGGAGLHRRVGPYGLELGYWVAHDRTRQGLGTEIAKMLTTAALEVPGITSTEIHHDKVNVVSGRIPFRLGYTLVGEGADEIAAPSEVGIECVWRMDVATWEVDRRP